jgi:hypothetical protein
MEEMRMHTKLWSEKLKGRDHLEGLAENLTQDRDQWLAGVNTVKGGKYLRQMNNYLFLEKDCVPAR